MNTLGQVEYVQHMGSDIDVVNAARVSFSKKVDSLSKNDEKLIKYLAEHNHWTPFSHCQVQLKIEMPIFIARQWFKSTVGFSRNEKSRRYVGDSPTFYYPEQWRQKPGKNIKQGSGENVSPALNEKINYKYDSIVEKCEELYNELILIGVAPEQARMILPQSMKTEFIETGSLQAYSRICNLRKDFHAQKEIQWFANEIDKIMIKLFPVSWKVLSNNYSI